MTVSTYDAHPYPIYNARYRVIFPILDADGDLVTGATSPDSELSQDSGTFADATNEATEIATNSGMYYLDLIASEMDTKVTAIIVKTATAGAKTTPIVLYPQRLAQIRTGTAQAGAASTITLDANASAVDDYYNGCMVNITNNSPANVQGQCRKIVDYVGSTKVATIEGAWGTNPSSASTFEILLTEHALLLDPVRGVGSPTALPNAAAEAAGGLYTRGTGAGQINQAANGQIDVNSAAIADAVLDEPFADHNTEDSLGNVLNDLIDENGGDGLYQFNAHALALAPVDGAPPSAATIADAVWDEARAGHAGIGTFGEGVASVQGNVAGSVAGPVASVAGNVGGNVVGSVASVTAGVSLANDAITSAKVEATALAEIADALWDEALAGHLGVGSVGEMLNVVGTLSSQSSVNALPSAAEVADAVWDEALADHNVEDSFGNVIGDVVDEDVGGVYQFNANALELAPTGGTAPTVVQIRQEMDANSTQLAAIAADTNDLQTRLPAALVSGRMDSSVGAMAADVLTAAALAADAVAELADGVLDETVEGAYTLRQLARLYAAALFGKLSGVTTNAPAFRDLGDTKDRIAATVTADGRTAVTLDAA